FMLDYIAKWKKEKLVREVNRSVPDRILPLGLTASLSDVSANSKGPDDELFKKNEELRIYLPRGLTILRIEDEHGNQETDFVVYASKKFFEFEPQDSSQSGTDERVLSKYFLSDAAQIHRVIAMEKINGEAAHFSGRFIKGKFYFIAGSKNVHLIFNTEEHLEMYTEDRYSIALTVASTLLHKWQAMDTKSQTDVAKFLHESKCTVFCEIMLPSKQHVVNISSLSQNKLVILGVTSPPEENPTSLTAMCSEDCINMFSQYGFDIPEYEVLSGYEYDRHFLKTRREKYTEGNVYYFEDASHNTIGMVKLKSGWYIHLRALREQASYRHTAKKNIKTLEEAKARARKRVRELQEFLFTPEEELEAWKQVADLWMEWVEEKVLAGHVTGHEIKYNFPLVWKPFAEQMRQSNEQLLGL
ncbi:hypothetical protein FHG87_003601, partial [Trinorchestia longiramus]